MSKKKQRSQVNDAQRANRLTISPQTDKQKEYLQALQTHDQVFAIGPAGAGKTYIPTVIACRMYLLGQIKKIILTRPAVEVGESHGFLPGSIHQKLAPWMQPVLEVMEDCFGGRGALLEAQKAGDIEVSPFAYMRGRTFRDAFVILDEAQNTTPKQMEMFLTRIGEGSRLVVSGDLRQSDLRGDSGLKVAMTLIERYKIPAPLIEFTSKDCVRSGMCKLWVEAFERGV